ncbi:hypothetical protein MZM54_05285 [[Brevibacterium] frigoritolerans]|nr:hypothetical protein [Peribacillus frigoritolerans]
MKNEQVDKAMKQAKASNEIENIEIADVHTALVRARLSNEITEEEFQDKVKEIVTGKKADRGN